jgi:hypothetical protein
MPSAVGTFVFSNIPRNDLATEPVAKHIIPWTDLRVFDAFQTVLPGTAASDDLGLINAVHGTGVPSVQTSDAKATTVTQKLRFTFALPANYITGSNAQLLFHAGMKTTESDGTATIDALAYKSNRKGVATGGDLVTTDATTINSLTLADKKFILSPTNLAPGDVIDVLVTIAITDTATGTAVIGWIGEVAMLLDIRG